MQKKYTKSRKPLKNPWDRISLDNWDDGYPYMAYRRPPEEKEAR